MTEEYDIVVIGSGRAGVPPAYKCAKAGWKAAIIDRQPFGGTCALRGCSPKKILYTPSDIVHRAEIAKNLEILKGNIRVDWSGVAALKKSFTDPIPQSAQETYEEVGLETHHGVASFVDKNTLKINDKTLKAGKIIIATGAKPRPLDFDGAELISTSDDFLELRELPGQMVFIGGGYISMELAHIARLAGAQVTVIEHSDRPLGPFDENLVEKLVKSAVESGIELKTGMAVTSLEKNDGAYIINFEGEGGSENLQCDFVVHGAGRVPWIDELELEKGGVDYGRKGIKVDEYMRSTSNPFVYAAGDVADTPGLPLSPVAGFEGYTLSENLLNETKKKIDYSGVPSVVFTIPPLAAVGLTEKQAKEKGLDYSVISRDNSEWLYSWRTGEKHSASKVLVEKESGGILGAHIFGHGAEEIINLFGFAIRYEITAPMLKEMIFAYPTKSSDMRNML